MSGCGAGSPRRKHVVLADTTNFLKNERMFNKLGIDVFWVVSKIAGAVDILHVRMMCNDCSITSSGEAYDEHQWHAITPCRESQF